MIEGTAFAKVNLSLRIGKRLSTGRHELHGLFQSISPADWLRIAPAPDDSISGPKGADVIDGSENLAFRAADAVREAAGWRQPLHVELGKRIPIAAGLGGGSADAAAALAMTARLANSDLDLAKLADKLGSDVPFCLVGGTAAVGGAGEDVHSLRPMSGFALAVVTPPIELATGRVFAQWDEMGGPRGETVPTSELPPDLREWGDVGNDLAPAAKAVAPALADWQFELTQRWGRRVFVTGSGPTLFAYFLDGDEAAAAIAEIPAGARFAEGAVPVPFGWLMRRNGVFSSPVGPVGPETAAPLWAGREFPGRPSS